MHGGRVMPASYAACQERGGMRIGRGHVMQHMQAEKSPCLPASTECVMQAQLDG